MMALKVPTYGVEYRSCNEGVIVRRLSISENSPAASRARRRHGHIADATVRVAGDFFFQYPIILDYWSGMSSNSGGQ